MKRTLNLIFIAILGLSMSNCTPEDGDIGPKGPIGEQGNDGKDGVNGNDGKDGKDGVNGKDGKDGKDGNANVQKFTFNIDSADWSNAVHTGDGNIHHYYHVSSSLTGGISMSNTNYAVIGYAKNLKGGYTNIKPIPSVFSTNGGAYGIKIDMGINRSEILLSKTFNGFDNNSFLRNELLKSLQIELVFIKIEELKRIEEEVDLTDYNAVMEYIKLNDSF